MRAHYLQPKVGHYGVFNGSRYRSEIAPRIADFVATHGRPRAANGARKANGDGAAPPSTIPSATTKPGKAPAPKPRKPAPRKPAH
jgi:poly(3-hydroxybutyrate) depolymerase